MDINLTPEFEAMVRHKVDSGMYSSVSEVIREALRLMAEKDQLQIAQLDRLRIDVQEGLSSGAVATRDPAEAKGAGRAAQRDKPR